VARQAVEVLGVPIDFLDMESVTRQVVDVASNRRFFQIATVNLDFLVHSRVDDEVGQILKSTAVNIADGAPVVWSGRILGCQRATRVAGADLVPTLMGIAADEGLRVFFLGGEHGSASEAARRLSALHPLLEVSVLEPPRAALEDMDDAAILGAIRNAQPHILLVAFGHPKQDKWIHRHRNDLPMVAIGVGGSFDLIAGLHPRAPRWLQKVGLEWAFRLAHEPRRLAARYATNGLWAVGALLPWVIWKRIGWSN
jgi:N-acetylglucosaminyldiphosphoundecaprenol N-acetyl-beta-D-mannosaminyltransferase